MEIDLKHTFGALLLAALSGLAPAASDTPSFADDPAVVDFVHDLARRQGFNADTLLGQFAKLSPNERVIELIKPPESPQQQRSWQRYRRIFLDQRRIDAGVAFWQQNAAILAKARVLYGVPEEIIVAILGVETLYGRNTGGFSTLEALSTLAFNYPPRAEFFRTELEQFFLLARENQLDPLEVTGSYAGAIGLPQFMPGSERRYAVDFDGDGRIDLVNSVDDAIGSVAHFLEQHGWEAEQPVAVAARCDGTPDPALIEAGIFPKLNVGDLAQKGIAADADPQASVALIDLVTPDQPTEYWLGYNNFYVITRYNRSSFYAMAVYQLAEEIRQRMPR